MSLAIDWVAALKAPATCQFWLDEIGANPTSPYDGSDEWTFRHAEWRCLATWSVTSQAEALAIEGWFARARGRAFALNFPNWRITGGVGTKTGAVTGTASKGATTVTISGGSGAFAIGDIIKVNTLTHERLHRIIGGNGTTSIDITPPLWFLLSTTPIKHRGDGSPITDMRETMLLASPLQGGAIFPSPLADSTGGLIESNTVELGSSKRAPA